ncbi:MAG TPA: phosphate ABC transporter substrate-binding protein PstS [Terriglobia bacterium]|nr:phosphate ABC transporter substrate-binding protein PstS [Terriglobia bacterium]
MRKGLLILAVMALLAAGVTMAATSITGAGSTFTYPIMSKWTNQYYKLHPDVQINYQSIGSGGGIKQVTEGTVDFGATDGPLDNQQIAEFKAKRGSNVLHFPTVLGGVVPIYNIPGVTATLNFTPAALAGIYLGHITKWNDAEIAKPNPGVKLPDHDIVVMHRSEGSGTTYCWADFLSKVSPEWKDKVGVGTAISWPVGLGGKGSEGVTGLVKQTPYSIGYVELIYSIQNKLSYGNVENPSGKFIHADLASVTEAAAGAAKTMPADFRVSITNAPGATAYPISTYTWLLVPQKIQDPAKKAAIVGFVHWVLTDGQKDAEPLAYAPLPKSVQAKELKALATVQ